MTTEGLLREDLSGSLWGSLCAALNKEDRSWNHSYLAPHYLGGGADYWGAPGMISSCCNCEGCLIGRLKRNIISQRKHWKRESQIRRQELASKYPNSRFLGEEGLVWLEALGKLPLDESSDEDEAYPAIDLETQLCD